MFLRFIFLLLGLIAVESCRLDPIADLEKTIATIDAAITGADDAWVKAFAQIKVLEVISTSLDPASPVAIEAQATKDSYQKQIDSYATSLDDLYAKRFELVSILSYLKKILSISVTSNVNSAATEVVPENADAIAKMNAYKQQYISKIGEINATLKVIESSIVRIQSIFEQSSLTADALSSLVAIVLDSKKAQDVLKVSLDALTLLNGQIKADFEVLAQQARNAAADFSTWLNDQQVVITRAKKSLEDRQAYFAQLDKQLDQKKAELAVVVNKGLDTQKALDDSAMAKDALFNLFKTKYAEASQLTQKISQAVWAIVSALGIIDKSIDSVPSLDSLAALSAQADSLVANFTQIGTDKNQLTATQDEEKKLLDEMQKIFTPDEMAGYQKTFSNQQEWIAKSVDSLSVLKDQFSMVQAKILKKKDQLMVKSTALSDAVAANFAASLEQFKNILADVKTEASSVIRDLNPLVMGISQKIIGLTDFFDLDVQTENSLSDLKKSLDDISSDYNSINDKLQEYAIYAKTFADSNSMIDSATQDQKLLNDYRKNFDEWNIWAKAVSDRQAALVKTIATAQKKYTKLFDALNASKSSVSSTKSGEVQSVKTPPAPAPVQVVDSKSVQSVFPVVENLVKPADTTSTSTDTQNKALDVAKSPDVSQPPVPVVNDGSQTPQAKDLAVQVADSSAEARTIKLIANLKTTMDSFAEFRKNVDDSKGIFEKTTSDADYQKASARATDVKKQLVGYQVIFEKLFTETEDIQKMIDQDLAASRNVSNSVVENLAGAKTIVSQAKKDLVSSKATFNDALQLFDRISVDYSKKTNALSEITAQASLVDEKIQSVKEYFNQIKSAIEKGNNTLNGEKTLAVLESALKDLSNIENIKTTITDDKVNILIPALNKLKKDMMPKYIQAYGQLPDSLSQTIDKQSLWIDGIDSLLNASVSTLENLRKNIQDAQKPLSEDDIKTFSALTFAQQMKLLEESIQSGQVEVFMKRLASSFSNRYGNRPEDKDVNVIANNKARLKRLVDFILPRPRFSSKRVILKGYSDQIV